MDFYVCYTKNPPSNQNKTFILDTISMFNQIFEIIGLKTIIVTYLNDDDELLIAQDSIIQSKIQSPDKWELLLDCQFTLNLRRRLVPSKKQCTVFVARNQSACHDPVSSL